MAETPKRRVSSTGKPLNKAAQVKGHGPSDIPNLGRPVPAKRSATIVPKSKPEVVVPPKADPPHGEQPLPTKKGPETNGIVKKNVAMRVGSGVKNIATDGKTGNGPVIPIMFCVFGIVAIAKMRGHADIDTKHAVFGGFLTTFVLLGLYRMNASLGTGFAVLILMAALLEYGKWVLPGLGAGVKAGVPTVSASQAQKDLNHANPNMKIYDSNGKLLNPVAQWTQPYIGPMPK